LPRLQPFRVSKKIADLTPYRVFQKLSTDLPIAAYMLAICQLVCRTARLSRNPLGGNVVFSCRFSSRDVRPIINELGRRGAWKIGIGRTVRINAAYDGLELALVRFDPESPDDASREPI
jgi:hypothetical protein